MKVSIALFLVLLSEIDLFGCDAFQGGTPRMKRSDANEVNQKWDPTWTDKLKKDLLLNYDKFSRPAQLGTKITAYVDMVIRHVEMDEQRSTMTIHSWLRLYWNDEKLKWNADEYGGLKELHLADHEIWQPDIYPYNGVIGGVSDHFGNTNCIARDNGSVIWVPPSIFQVFCQMDLTYWPFDTQVCNLVLGSWTYNELQLSLEVLTSDDNTDRLLVKNSEWKVVKLEKEKHSTFYPCCPEAYSDVTFTITVQRQSSTCVTLLITPAAAVIVMALCVFLIPPTSTNKFTLGSVTVLVVCLFLLYFTQKIPAMATQAPLLVEFYSRTLHLLSLSLVISAVVVNIAKNPKSSPLPWTVKRLLTGCLGKCLLLVSFTGVSQSQSKADASLPVLSDDKKQQTEGSYGLFQQDWMLLAVAIDRLAFLVYCFIFVVFAINYSV